jgi:hypothetical protein
LDFRPDRPCTSFSPPSRRRDRQRATELRFVEQGGRRFVVKSYAEPGDGPDEAARRAQREIDAVAAFRRAGAGALEPLAGPLDTAGFDLDGRRVELRHALVFPFVEVPTLYDAIADATDATPLVAEAGRRIRARHAAADSIAAIHSDGSAHNVFADWTWFDFCEPHSGDQVRECKGLELLRFVASVVEVSRAGTTRRHVATFCDAYADRHLLALALDYSRTEETQMRLKMWSRMLGRPDKLVSLWRGDTTQFRRIRTWDALDHALR